MVMKAVIFDLDDTLVDSSHIRELRDGQEWDEIRSRLDQVNSFEGVTEMLRRIKESGCAIAVVTSSPRWYAERLIAQHAFPVDTLIAAGDYKYPKPGPDPMRAALRTLQILRPKDALAVGDRCIDTASAHGAEVAAIGATWGAPNLRDLRLSFPEYIAAKPGEVIEILDALRSGRTDEGIAKKNGWFSSLKKSDVWRTNPPGDYRPHLTGDRDYIYARYKYAGPWNISYTNSLIKSFKAKERNQRFFKEKAARQFCVELRNLVPKGGYLTYVLPSTKKGDPGYDNRFELLAEYLQGEGRTSLWPLQVKASTEPAHEAAPDSDLRDPDNIMANLEWVQGIPAECEEIYIVDDVLTKGGHLRAYADFIQQAYPDLTIKCVAWALHTSTQWYEPQA